MRFQASASLMILLALVLGCPDTETRFDFDGDGVEDSADCAPEDPDNFPGNTDPYDDGVDTNCDGYDGIDGDGDGYPSNVDPEEDWFDCNDANDHVHPGADDTIGDGTDNNCDGVDGVDADGDGHAAGDGLTLDCDDSDPDSYPGATEVIDGRDNDCDGSADEGTDAADDDGDGYCEGYDLDGDGSDDCSGTAQPGDCDDDGTEIHPGASEDEDGIDNDCDGLVDDGTDAFDDDGDGFSENAGDCDDDAADVHPGAQDDYGDGLDTDCDSSDGVDLDGDGYPANPELVDEPYFDCNDNSPAIYPGQVDAVGDGLDNNCDGMDGTDLDGDGYASDLFAGTDCDDGDATIHPGAAETANCTDDDCDGNEDEGTDSVDSDGDGYCVGVDLGNGLQCCAEAWVGDCNDLDPDLDPADLDADGYATCDGDCDDDDPAIHPGAVEICNMLDDDCDGMPGNDEADEDGDTDPWCTDCDDTDPALNTLDTDGDTWTTCDGDCDDSQAWVNPMVTDLVGDGYDQNCDDIDGMDLDGDGEASVASGGTDCDDTDPNANNNDGDNDGWTGCDGDCDDTDPQAYPDRAELCDLVDNDCDGDVDEDTSEDGDGDGWFACQGDCDDLDIDVFPGAPELCDLIDNDCDGLLGPGEEDDDGDGWTVCEGDCDDGDMYVNPHAAELCDGLDSDCDGAADDGCLSCDWTVPTDAASIGLALDGAADGDVICIEPGLYSEQVGIGYSVVLAGLAGSRATVIDGAQAGVVVEISDTAGPDTVLTGLGITGGLAAMYGGGVFVDGASPTLRKLALWDNHATWGGGVAVYDPSEAVLEDLVFEDNSCDQWGGGLYIRGNATPSDVTVRRARFVHNDGGGYVGGGGMAVYGSQCQVQVEQLLFERNTAAGGGAMLVYGSEMTASQVWVQANHSETGSAIFNYQGTLLLENAALVANTGHGALESDSGITSLTNVTFVANQSSSVGGAVYHDASDPLELTNVAISYNEAPNGGAGLWILGTGGLQATHCNIWGNVGDDVDGATYTPGVDGNLSSEPYYLDTSHPNPEHWDLHLASYAPLVDAGEAGIVDPDGSPSDIGAYGGPGGASWDVDHDGWHEWWQPSEYDAATYPAAGWDCDDRDAGVYPGNGC
jgi:hypothetical protein